MGDLEKPTTDMSSEEWNSMTKYKDSGNPGLSKISESDAIQWFELYMSGKTYSEIAAITSSEKNMILYFSDQFKWYDKKMNHFSDLFSNMAQKLTQVKLSSTNSMATIVAGLGKHFEETFNQYLSTNDKSIVDTIDTKLLSQYYKAVDTLEKLVSPNKKSNENDPPPVNINMYGDTSVQESSDNTIEVTSKNAGDILKAMAKAKKIEKNT